MYKFRVVAALFCAAASLLAVDTKNWEQGEMSDFEKGSLTKLSLASDGRVTPAPRLTQIFDPSVTFLWALVRDSKGNLYTGGGTLGGSKVKLFGVDASGKGRTVTELDGMTIQALAVDKQDRVYAATSPDGKVYRVDPASGKADVFYDPKAKYIWALAFSSRGDLFVATGDQGEIHRVTPAGQGSVFFRTEEAHARSLAIDSKDNLIVGTDPSGLILRITPAGEGFVLYQAAKREVTALTVAADGTIYAAGVGNKVAAAAVAAPAPPVPAAAPAAPGGGVTLTVAGPRAPAPPTIGNAGAAIAGGSEIYRVQADGYARRIWSNAQDLVYVLALDARGRVLAGAGNKGTIYRLDNDRNYTRLVDLAPSQVTALAAGPGGKLYAATGNIGEVFSVGPDLETSGTFESEVYDAGGFSYWGALTHEFRQQDSITFETRSGNVNRAQKDWSPWMKLNGERIASPAARFLQYRATVTGTSELIEIDAAYLMKNVPPTVDALEATPANYKFPAPAAPAAAANPPITLPPLGRPAAPSAASAAADSGTSPALTWAKGQIGARWLATDENGDTLTFKLEIRGEKETAWKLLKDGIREHYYSWDSTAFPDGKYVLRVTASDAPSNPPGAALTAMLESDPMLIDNTPPEISALQGTRANGKIDLRFHAKDGLNTLDKAEYSVNGGDWLVIEPTTHLMDAKELDFRTQVDAPAGEVTVAIRISDDYDNQVTAKTVVP